jgi:RHS repeat-associated protein
LAYDAQGNLALRNGQPFIFDMGNRLRSAPGPENYLYDAEGRRVLAWLQGSGSILSMYDGDGKLRRQQSERDGKSREYLYLGGMLVATLETGTDGVTRPTYQHLDALGSPVAVTDASGTVVERSYYEPYGELRNRPLTDGIGYAGHVSDSANNLSYMQQRYYDPSIGIFLSVDPITALQKPASHFNRYRYANNNPYKFIDPNGETGRVAWLVRLTANQAHKVARITQEQAVAARRAGQNVVADRRQVASQIETAAHGRADQLKDAAHELEDGSKGLPHYQTEGIRGHSFWGKLSVAALAAAGALEQVAEAAEYIPDPTPRPAEQADIDRWNNLMGTINKSTGIPMPGVKVGQDGGFQGYFNVGGRLDSKKLDEKLNGNR